MKGMEYRQDRELGRAGWAPTLKDLGVQLG